MSEEEPLEITLDFGKLLLPIAIGIALWLMLRYRRRRAG
jgi:hypothetical protein